MTIYYVTLTHSPKCVLISPGAIQFTLILSSPSSLANAIVKPNKAVLLTQ